MPESALLADRRTAGSLDPAEVITVTLGDLTFRAGRRTAAHIQATIKALAVQHPGAHFHIMQSCYHQGYEPSKYTHDYDAVIDVRIDGLDWWVAQRFMREQGWACWYRHTGSWAAAADWHIHAVSIGCPGPVGIYVPAQVVDYYHHTFGLSGQHNVDLDKSWFPGDVGPNPPVGTPAQWKAAIDATIFDFALWERELEDDMPWTDWTKDEQKAMAAAVAGETVKQLLAAIVDGGRLTFGQAVRQAANVPALVRRLGHALKVDLGKDEAGDP